MTERYFSTKISIGLTASAIICTILAIYAPVILWAVAVSPLVIGCLWLIREILLGLANIGKANAEVDAITAATKIALLKAECDKANALRPTVHHQKHLTFFVYHDGNIKTIFNYPTDLDQQRFILALERQSFTKLLEKYEPPQLAPPPQYKLLDVFSQMLQVYAIIAGQQVGKTFQARHVMAMWQMKGATTWLIGPKWDKGEWENCRKFGGGNDYQAVNQGLVELRNEASRRHRSELGNKDHPPLMVVLDDWTPIVEQCAEAATFILEATTLFASVNIILLFLIHADTAAAWGVERKGAALKDNFIKVFIIPTYDSHGQVMRDKTRAEIKLPGDAVRSPVLLENQPVRWPVLPNNGLADGLASAVTEDIEDRAPWMNENLADQDRIYLYLSAAHQAGEDIVRGYGRRQVKITLGLVGSNEAISQMVSEAKTEILEGVNL